MGIIEQAAKRLEELKRAGVEVDTRTTKSNAHEMNGSAALLAQEIAKRERGADSPFKQSNEVEHKDVPAQITVEPAPTRRSRIVELDLVRLANEGFVAPNAQRSQLADEMRVIKRPLLANAQGKSAAPINAANRIMITSALPGEGKTFVSVNLALSIAMELDHTVLLVDADVARPAIPERLGISAERGLLDLLIDSKLDVADVLLKTNIERLSILPAGRPHSRATEILASEGMNRLVEDLSNRYADRILIFDAPPLLPSTESRALATHMGQVLVVVESERTSQSSVLQAMATLETCPVVMTVLNKIERSEVGSYYGYYGAYGQ